MVAIGRAVTLVYAYIGHRPTPPIAMLNGSKVQGKDLSGLQKFCVDSTKVLNRLKSSLVHSQRYDHDHH